MKCFVAEFDQFNGGAVNTLPFTKYASTHTHKFIKWLYYNASAQEQLLHTQTRTVHVNSQHFRVVQTVYCQLAARWKLLAAAGLAGAARLIN